MDALQLRDNAKQHLQQIKDIESGTDYLNKVRGIEAWARAEKKDAELQNLIAEQKIRTQRILGRLLKENGVSKNAGDGSNQHKKSNGKDAQPKLSDYGLSKYESSTFQKIASLPDEDFEHEIAVAKEESEKRVELTTSRLLRAAERAGKNVHVSNNSGENEWYTPPKIIESARKVMGCIDLDPASCEKANEAVKAEFFYSKEVSGIENDWHGNVWLNPPYSQPLIDRFSQAFYDKWEQQEFKQGIILVNNATETKWFQRLLSTSDCICFIQGRVKFLDAQGNPNGAPLQGQAILYFGSRSDEFVYEFSNYGVCVWRAVK